MLADSLTKADFVLFETDKKIASLLLSSNIFESEKLEFIIKDPKNKTELLEKLIEFNFISHAFFKDFIKHNFNLCLIKPEEVDFAGVEFLEESFLNIFAKERFIPILENAEEIVVASRFALNAGEDIKISRILKTNKKINLQFAFNGDLQNLIQKVFRDKEKLLRLLRVLNSLGAQNAKRGEVLNIKDPIVEFTETLLEEACIGRAEEVNFTCDDIFVSIRFKIDLVFKEIGFFQKEVWGRVINRFKMLCGASLSEVSKIQIGKMKTVIFGNKYDISFYFLPTSRGESVSIKFTKQNQHPQSLEDLNLTKVNLQKITKMLEQKEGMVLLNFEGKNLISSFLNTLDLKNLEVLNVIEDLEVKLSFVKNLKAEISLDFIKDNKPDILIAQKPDVVGVKSFCFFDINDAFSMIQSADISKLCGIIIALKIRKLCDFCKVEVQIELEILTKLRLAKTDVRKIYKASGCAKCNEIGYSGTILIWEVLSVDLEVEEILSEKHLTRKKFLESVKKKGFATIFEDARLKVLQGLTDIEELKRAIGL